MKTTFFVAFDVIYKNIIKKKNLFQCQINKKNLNNNF